LYLWIGRLFENILLIQIENATVNLGGTRSRFCLDLSRVFLKSDLAPFYWKILFHKAQLWIPWTILTVKLIYYNYYGAK